MDKIEKAKQIWCSIHDTSSWDQICAIGKALSSRDRLRILELIQYSSRNLLEISRELSLPLSSVAKHINVLEEANIIFVNYLPAKKGHSKICNKSIFFVAVTFEEPFIAEASVQEHSVEIPVGYFSECNITAPCGMAGAEKCLVHTDDPDAFFFPERVGAELLWFEQGYVSYNFPNNFFSDKAYNEISFSMEICSEAVYYRNDWPSDISIFVNDSEIATFTSAGDFGGSRGKYTPAYWPVNGTQFGILKTFKVTEEGVYIDNCFFADSPKISGLNLDKHPFIKLTIGIKEDALHKGGINIFGKRFGNYPQAIVMKVKKFLSPQLS